MNCKQDAYSKYKRLAPTYREHFQLGNVATHSVLDLVHQSTQLPFALRHRANNNINNREHIKTLAKLPSHWLNEYGARQYMERINRR